MIYSASYYNAEINYNDKFFYLKKQSISFVFAIVLFFLSKKIDTQFFKRNNVWFYSISIILLLLVFVPKIGVENYGAKRWLNLGITTFQPSELAKFALVIILSTYLSTKSCDKFSVLLKAILIAVPILVLIIIEPNMSITICVGMVTFIMLIVGGIKPKYVIMLSIPVIALAVLLILMEPYRIKRLLAFINPWANPLGEGYQLIQSYYAISSGKIFGVGLFNSRQKYLFLPFAESDFIFSIIGEEWGLIGCIVIIILFCIVISEGYKIAINAKDRFSAYLATGITSIIAIQSILNIAVVTGSVPPTGLPLPFVSFGGSSLVVFYFFVGVLDNLYNSQSKLLLHKI